MDSDKCFMCEDPSLGSSVSFILNGEDCKVPLCEECSDEYTLKSIKMKYRDYQKEKNAEKEKLDKIIKYLESNGYKVTGNDLKNNENKVVLLDKNNDQIDIIDKSDSEDDKPEFVSVSNNKSIPVSNNNKPEKDLIKTSQMMVYKDVSGIAKSGDRSVNLPKNSSYNIDNLTNEQIQKLINRGLLSEDVSRPENFVLETADYTIRGVKGNIPKLISGNTGTTRIDIDQNFNDKDLQKKFKAIADESNASEVGTVNWDYGGEPITCNVCRGSGIAMKQMCPKCKGTGLMKG